LILPEGCCYEIIRRSGDASTNRVYGDHNDYVAYSTIDALEDSKVPEDGIHRVNHEYVNSTAGCSVDDLSGIMQA